MKKKVLTVLALVPLVLGTIGYIFSGERITNAIYAAFALYFTNPISDAYNVYIEIARWTAPLVTATAILCALQNVWESLRNRVVLFGKKDSVSVYSDMDCRIRFGKDVGAIYPGDKLKKYAHEHIIMFSTDEMNLQFYEKHKKELAGKKVYIGVRDIECCFLNPLEDVTIFDINGAIARMLWKEISLWNKEKNEFNIVVWGSNTLSGEILRTGLQMNLFSKKQKIKYCFVTDNSNFSIRHSELNLMNNDEVSYLDYKNPQIWDAVSNADLIIVADVPDVETMQTLVVKAGESKIYYYSPVEGDVISHFSFGNVVAFGRNETVLTDENIRRGALIEKAQSLNTHYADQYGSEKDWNKLSGFLKGSNISAADFGEVLSVLNERIGEEEQAELEHIRWCRYMFLNYYTLGTPTNGKNRDDDKRIHKDLVDFSELDPKERVKDVEAIRITKVL